MVELGKSLYLLHRRCSKGGVMQPALERRFGMKTPTSRCNVYGVLLESSSELPSGGWLKEGEGLSCFCSVLMLLSKSLILLDRYKLRSFK